MDSEKILKFCLEKGLLLDKEVLGLFSGTSDVESAKFILEKVKNYTHQRIITKNLFFQNKDQVNKFLLDLPKESQKNLQNLKIKLGLSIEITKGVEQSQVISVSNISKENSSINTNDDVEEIKGVGNVKLAPASEFFTKGKGKESCGVLIKSPISIQSKKLEVKDFVKHFRGRLNDMKGILQEHSELSNLVSINKIGTNRQRISIIGIVSSKRITKNKNILFDVEDLTGKIRVLVNQNNEELYKKAEEVTLDSVIGFKGSANGEIMFTSDIVFPGSTISERKKGCVEECALFIGDLHIGSKLFMEENFLKFIDYLNGKLPNTPEVSKIKYLFVSGDLISGVGIYPGQENELLISDVEAQFEKAAELFGKIRRDINIIISSGNHDAVRIMEPQPMFDEKFAWPLYNLRNITLVSNPSQVNIGKNEYFSGFDVLIYHGYSYHYYAGNISRLIIEKAVHTPDKIMHYLLKHRHLAPTHSSTLYYPAEDDALMIREVPDIFISGHTHKSAISYYNNILTISCSSWESKTAFQEKMGNEPDFCKVPLFNLKTRAIKVLDFE